MTEIGSGRRLAAASGKQTSIVPAVAMPADAMMRIDQTGTPTISIPMIASLSESITARIGIAGKDGSD